MQVVTFRYSDNTNTVIIGTTQGNSTSLELASIPSTVTSIGNSAFYNYTTLSGSIRFESGSSLTSIGQSAFGRCASLTGVSTFPKSLVSIGNSAFSRCTQLTGGITFDTPSSLTTIGEYAFNACNLLNGALTLPESLTSIGTQAFKGCSGFNGPLTLPESLTSIGMQAFQDCSGLTGDLIIPSKVTTISTSAFNGCSGFNGFLRLPKSLVSIEGQAFYGCSSLTGSVRIPPNVTTLDPFVFQNTGITKIYYTSTNGATVVDNKIGDIPAELYYTDGTFIYSDNTKTGLISVIDKPFTTGALTVPITVTLIYGSAFAGCNKLTSISYYSTTRVENATAFTDVPVVSTIQTDGTFIYLDYTKTTLTGIVAGTNATGALTIPINVTSVTARALAGCNKLTSITYYSTTTIGTDAFSGVPRKNILYTDRTFLYSSSSKTTLTGIVAGTNATGALTIPITVTSVAARALAGCTKLTSISYYSTTTTIGTNAFSGVKKVIVLYTDRKFLYSSSGKTTLTGIVGGINATGALTIPITVTSVAARALAGCTKLTSISYYSTTTIGTGAFTGVKKVNVSYTDHKFLYSTASKAIIRGVLATTGTFPAIPTTVVTGILDNAFKNSKLTSTSLTIPKNVKTVGKSAFAGCTGIKAITYYSSTTKVDTTSFTGIAKVNVLRAMLDVKRLAMHFPVLKSD